MLTSFQSVSTQTDYRMTSHMMGLSRRELEILNLIAYEYSSKEIAHMLFLSTETINTHRKNIMIKLEVKNTAGMIRVACQKEIIAL